MEEAAEQFLRDLNTGRLTYDEAKLRYQQLDQGIQERYHTIIGEAIQRRYQRNTTALSLDVVQSRGAKGAGNALDAQLTFDAYHRWVEEKLAAHGCHRSDFAWSGDGLLAIFELPANAVALGKALIQGISVFNACYNRLSVDIQIRVGVHTGPILPGDAPGVGKIASATFDLAGHFQKVAQPNHMLLSAATQQALPGRSGEFALTVRRLPSPIGCYTWPAEDPAASSEPTLEAFSRPIPAVQEPTAIPAEPGQIPWTAISLGAVAMVIVAALLANWLIPGRNAGPEQSNAPVRLTAGTSSPAGNAIPPPVSPSPAGTPGTTRPVTPAAPARAPAPGAGPGAVPWKSPDADSGIPVRLLQPPPDHTWILSIGVGKYLNSALDVPGAGADALAAAQLLAAAFRTPPSNVQVLSDQTATERTIRDGFLWLQNRAGGGRDAAIIYLSGAAGMTPQGYQFLPHDTGQAGVGGVLGREFVSWLAATHAQTILCFVDTPQAAAVASLLPRQQDPGRQLLLVAAAGADTTGALPRSGQSSTLLAGLGQALNAAADADRDGVVRLADALQFTGRAVQAASQGRQTPEAHPAFTPGIPELVLRTAR